MNIDKSPLLETVKDFAEENVISALQQLIDEGHIYFSFTEEGELSIIFQSFKKPEKEDEPSEYWSKEFTLIDKAIEWAGDYNNIEPLSDEQKEDLEERAVQFDRLAAEFRKAAGLIPKDK